MIRYSPLILFVFLSCAKVVAPSGGPVDKDSPEVISVFPAPGFVDEIPDEIKIVFSENIRDSEDAVKLYPAYYGGVTVHGREADIVTGVDTDLIMVTISSTLEDMRGNRIISPEIFVWNSMLEDSFAGLSLSLLRDGGGSVTSSARCEFFLLPDTLSSRITHYPDTLGNIHARWLSKGNYRIVCYEDVDRSRAWDPVREPGVATEITLSSGDNGHIDMMMTIVDSVGPTVSDMVVLDGWHLETTWNEQITVDHENLKCISVTGPDGVPVEIYGVKISAGRSSTGRMTVYTGELSDTLFTVAIGGIADISGNLSFSDTLEVWGSSSIPANVIAVQSAYPAHGSYDVPATGPFFISFTDWVDKSAVESCYTITRVADSTDVAGEFIRTSATAFSFTPYNQLLGDRQYRVDLLPGLTSLQGDSVSEQSWTFIPAWSDQPGSISGVITGTGASAVTVVVTPTGGNGEILTAKLAPGAYNFPGIAGGRYTVSVFVDWNLDDIWTPGEPYGAWPGVVEVFPGIDSVNTDIQVVP